MTGRTLSFICGATCHPGGPTCNGYCTDSRIKAPGTYTEAPEQACAEIAEKARFLVNHAAFIGVVLTVEQQPTQPLRMGGHETVIAVRPRRD